MASPNLVSRLALSDSGTTEAIGVNITQTRFNAVKERGDAQFTAVGSGEVNGICHDYSGNLYMTDRTTHAIYKISEGNQLTVFAGQPGSSGDLYDVSIQDDTPLNRAAFNAPRSICCDRSGNLYVADTGNNKIKVISGGRIKLLAGSTRGFVDADDGKNAKFDIPVDVAIDREGNLYVADAANHAIRKVFANGKVLTIAGNGSAGNATNVRASKYIATFDTPVGVAVDKNDNVFVLDKANHIVKKIVPRGWVYRFSGSGANGKSLGTNDAANGYTYSDNCSYQALSGCDVDDQGNLYVVDMGWPEMGAWGRLLKLDVNGRPGVVVDFNALSQRLYAYDVTCTPANKLFVVFSNAFFTEMSSSSSSSTSYVENWSSSSSSSSS